MRCILLIDDDEDELLFFKEALMLLHSDLVCSYAKDADEGMAMLDKLSPAMIFIDFNMPRINGINCIKAIRKKEAYNVIPIVFYTNGLNDGLKKKAMAAGASYCVQKPIEIKTLSDLLLFIMPQIDEKDNHIAPDSTS